MMNDEWWLMNEWMNDDESNEFFQFQVASDQQFKNLTTA